MDCHWSGIDANITDRIRLLIPLVKSEQDKTSLDMDRGSRTINPRQGFIS